MEEYVQLGSSGQPCSSFALQHGDIALHELHSSIPTPSPTRGVSPRNSIEQCFNGTAHDLARVSMELQELHASGVTFTSSCVHSTPDKAALAMFSSRAITSPGWPQTPSCDRRASYAIPGASSCSASSSTPGIQTCATSSTLSSACQQPGAGQQPFSTPQSSALCSSTALQGALFGRVDTPWGTLNLWHDSDASDEEEEEAYAGTLLLEQCTSQPSITTTSPPAFLLSPIQVPPSSQVQAQRLALLARPASTATGLHGGSAAASVEEGVSDTYHTPASSISVVTCTDVSSQSSTLYRTASTGPSTQASSELQDELLLHSSPDQQPATQPPQEQLLQPQLLQPQRSRRFLSGIQDHDCVGSYIDSTISMLQEQLAAQQQQSLLRCMSDAARPVVEVPVFPAAAAAAELGSLDDVLCVIRAAAEQPVTGAEYPVLAGLVKTLLHTHAQLLQQRKLALCELSTYQAAYRQEQGRRLQCEAELQRERAQWGDERQNLRLGHSLWCHHEPVSTAQQQPVLQASAQEQPVLQAAAQEQPVLQAAAQEQPALQASAQEQPVLQAAVAQQEQQQGVRAFPATAPCPPLPHPPDDKDKPIAGVLQAGQELEGVRQ